MATPWQARLALIGFLAIGAAIAANLLLMQEPRTAVPTARSEPPQPVPSRPKIAPLRPKIAPLRPEAGAKPQLNAPKRVRAARRPATTAATR